MVWQDIWKFFKQLIHITMDGWRLYVLNRNKEEVLSRKLSLWFIFIYGAIMGSIRVILQVAFQVVTGFFQLTREIFMNMIIFPFFITVFASVLLTISARGIGGKGYFRPIVNYMFYANTFQIAIPFFDLIFNKILGIPYIFDFGFWGPWDPYNPWQSLFYDKLVGLSAGIIIMYLLIIIRVPKFISINFKLSLKKAVLASCSLLFMFWIIFIAWPYWFFYLPRFLPLPTGADGYSFVFLVCILIVFPYFWKNLKKEVNIEVESIIGSFKNNLTSNIKE